MDAAPSYDLTVVMGDFNAQTDSNNCGYEDVIGTMLWATEMAMGIECSVSVAAVDLKLEAVFFNARTYTKELGDHLTAGR